MVSSLRRRRFSAPPDGERCDETVVLRDGWPARPRAPYSAEQRKLDDNELRQALLQLPPVPQRQQALLALNRLVHGSRWAEYLLETIPPSLVELESAVHEFRYERGEVRSCWFVLADHAQATIASAVRQPEVPEHG